MKKAVMVFMVLLAGSAGAAGSPDLFPRSERPAGLYTIELSGLSSADRHLARIIQGMVSRERPELYLIEDRSGRPGDKLFLSYYQKEYGVADLGSLTLDEALERYADRFRGYAVFSFDEPWTVNVADVYCSINDCLPVTQGQELLAQEAGLDKVEDFRGRWKDPVAAVRWSFKELYPQCSQKVIASTNAERHVCRDYCFAHRIFCFYLVTEGAQYAELRRILASTPANIPVIGYIARNGIEEWIVEYTLAAESKFMVPTDTVPNLTVHSGIPVQPLPEIQTPAEPPDLRGKLGVALAFTDGDNLHLEAEYYPRPDYWQHPERGRIKVAWSMAPQLYDLAPGMLRYYYQTKTDNDFFVALSGAGYTFASAYADQDFFRRVSLEYMSLTRLDVLWTLDPRLYLIITKGDVRRLLDPLGHDPAISLVLAGYAPPINLRDRESVPGYPPLLYSKPFYFSTTPGYLRRLIAADAAFVPARGRVVFYGVNNWTIDYQDLLDLQDHFRGTNVVFISVPEARAVIRQWEQGKP